MPETLHSPLPQGMRPLLYSAARETTPARQALPANLKFLLLPLAALFVVVPLQAHGSACGDDFPFHVTNWLDAARQMRGGTLYPHWTEVGAYHAGEPRFTFYPPVSWMLGALLVLLLPSAPVTVVFIFLALVAAGFAMYTLARQYTTPNVALFCAMLYTANPYMVCNAVERSAFAELLCATWMPLLLLGLLRRRPTVAGLALPLALLWLTNVPSAISGAYTFGFVLLLRLIHEARSSRIEGNGTGLTIGARHLLGVGAAGFALGVTLPAFYLLPAILERRFIQGAAAFGGDLQVSGNFLFGHNGFLVHDLLLRQVSWIAVLALPLGIASLALTWKRASRQPETHRHVPGSDTMLPLQTSAAILLSVCVVAGFALFSPSAMLWRLPALGLLQFPWRLLTLLFVPVVLGLGLLLQTYGRHSRRLLALAPALALPLALLAVHTYRRGSVVPHFDQYLAHLTAGGHGFHETPEYTPVGASNASLRINDPGYWLGSTSDAEAPGTFPNGAPYPFDPNFAPGWGPATTASQPAPRHLALQLAEPAVLVLHLRAYRHWEVFRNGAAVPLTLHRPDGLIALALPKGPSTIDVRWHQTPDQYFGAFVTFLAASSLLTITARRKRPHFLQTAEHHA